MPTSIPLSIQTTYRDLLDRHARRPMPEIEGSVSLVRNGGHDYWVVRRRIGARVKETRVGPDNEETRIRAEQHREENEAVRNWAREAGMFVAQLRAARMPTPTTGTGKLINALARVGFFRAGGVLAGAHAYGLYALELGVRAEDALALTEDVDIAAPPTVRVISESRRSLVSDLEGVGLTPVAGPGEAHPLRWQTEDGVVLDVLTPKRRGGDIAVRHDGLGVWAQALSYLDYSLQNPIDAVVLYREGVPVRIPAPERFAVHKLIVAAIRSGTHRAKTEKDLSQAAWLIEALVEARPFELVEAIENARRRGPKWRRAIDASLTRRADVAEMIDGL
ncbi:GSU2403 family nucleotidyltransferase fold protein [Primorskyibacter sp. 2E233]|uniref:GSU2403 family nucleotidyltransferase fold protein n=1 Tax=Primorskyibacter sp. 2E233 TaxID=3413431 RepID=UPI003BF0CBE5